MSHLPINHPTRPFYRVVTGLTGAGVITFGVVGWVETAGGEWFGQDNWTALGLPTNRAFAMLSIIAGLVLLTAAFVGRNLDHIINMAGAVGFMLVGTVMLALTHTDLNFLNFSVLTVSVSYVIGLILLAAALYTKVGPAAVSATEAGAQHAAGTSIDETALAAEAVPAGKD